LAACYYHLQKYSTAIIIYEGIQDMPPADKALYVKCLIKENALQQAIDIYQQLIALHPDFADEEIDSHLRMPSGGGLFDEFDEEEDNMSGYFMQKPQENLLMLVACKE
jgi:tetratricopeptide (TPR) repeat protein